MRIEQKRGGKDEDEGGRGEARHVPKHHRIQGSAAGKTGERLLNFKIKVHHKEAFGLKTMWVEFKHGSSRASCGSPRECWTLAAPDPNLTIK